jgi:hypothetical protein
VILEQEFVMEPQKIYVVLKLPGIEPGYIVFPSHKKNVQLLLGVLLSCEKKISSSAPGLDVMTHRECHVDCPFPVT